MILLEVCVDTAAGLDAALAGGADRIELCSSLELGGLTPSAGLLSIARERGATARAMIRPRAGDFVFSPADAELMRADIKAARQAGIEGVVLGASRPDGTLDLDLLRHLAETSQGLKRTLHRAFDLVPDIEQAVDQAVALGFDTILTSGRAASALEGLADLEKMHRHAAGRIVVMAGAGINAHTVLRILPRVALEAVHGSCSVPAQPGSEAAARLGFVSPDRRETDLKHVAALKKALAHPAYGA